MPTSVTGVIPTAEEFNDLVTQEELTAAIDNLSSELSASSGGTLIGTTSGTVEERFVADEARIVLTLAPNANDPATGSEGDHYFNTTTNSYRTYHSGTWVNDDTYLLQQMLGSISGQQYVAIPATINILKSIPSFINGQRFLITGFASANDGKGGEWYFDSSNLSLYPGIYIAPDFDLTGASGVLRLNEGNHEIAMEKYGVGTFSDNSSIIEQLVKYNAASGKRLQLPRGYIYCRELNLPSYDPKLYGVMSPSVSSGGGNGTVLMFDGTDAGVNSTAKLASVNVGGSTYHVDDLIFLSNDIVVKVTAVSSGVITAVRVLGVGSAPYSSIPSNPMSQVSTSGTGIGASFNITWGASPCIRISGTSSSRITGLELFNFTVASLNYESTATQTDRSPLLIEYAGGITRIENVYVLGFAQGVIFNELWDGEVNMDIMYTGTDGVHPAMWAGSYSTDNTNAILFRKLHIEHCSWCYALDYCELVSFIAEKIETGNAPTTNYPAITVSTLCRHVTHWSPHFVTGSNNPGYFLQDYGQASSYESPWFISSDSLSSDTYTGILWIDTSEGSGCIFSDARVGRIRQVTAVGNTSLFPIHLGNFNRWAGGLITLDIGVTAAGIFMLENDTFCDPVITADSTGKAGSAYFCHGLDNHIIGRATQGTVIGLLTSGTKQNLVENTTDGSSVVYGAGTSLYVEGVKLAILNYSLATTIVLFNTEQGQIFTVYIALTSKNITLQNNSNLILLGGANMAMTPGQAHGFICNSGTNTCQQIW
jgi:hypothetical protein